MMRLFEVEDALRRARNDATNAEGYLLNGIDTLEQLGDLEPVPDVTRLWLKAFEHILALRNEIDAVVDSIEHCSATLKQTLQLGDRRRPTGSETTPDFTV